MAIMDTFTYMREHTPLVEQSIFQSKKYLLQTKVNKSETFIFIS